MTCTQPRPQGKALGTRLTCTLHQSGEMFEMFSSASDRLKRKTGPKFHINQSQTNNWSFTEKNHEGSQTDLPKDVVWKSCKVKTYLVRSALQIYFTPKHKRSPSSVQVHVLVDCYSLMRLVSESILILWRHRLRVSSWTKRGVSLKEERTYWQFIV